MKRTGSSNVRSTTASGSAVYESERAVHEYLLFHYGDQSKPDLQMPYAFGPSDALRFIETSAKFCVSDQRANGRVLDIGCAVGGTSFELAKSFDEVLGIDFSQHFIDAANEMKSAGTKQFQVQKQGKRFIDCVASIAQEIDRSRISFRQGDACNLPEDIGTFLCVS